MGQKKTIDELRGQNGAVFENVEVASGITSWPVEQIRTCIAYARTNVKLVAGYSGVSDFKDGPTHHSIMDIAVMRAMPNLVVVAPADAAEVKKILPLVAEHDGPAYICIRRFSSLPMVVVPPGPPEFSLRQYETMLPRQRSLT